MIVTALATIAAFLLGMLVRDIIEEVQANKHFKKSLGDNNG